MTVGEWSRADSETANADTNRDVISSMYSNTNKSANSSSYANSNKNDGLREHGNSSEEWQEKCVDMGNEK